MRPKARRKLHRLGQQEQLDQPICEWLEGEENRRKLETLMTLLDCSAAEAVQIHLLNIIACDTSDMATDGEDDWGPGAKPPKEE